MQITNPSFGYCIYEEPIKKKYGSGASFTKLACISDVSFGNFLLWNTYNFLKLCNSFYFWMPSLNYNCRFKTKISVKNYLSLLFSDLKFCKHLEFSLSEHCKWGTWPPAIDHQSLCVKRVSHKVTITTISYLTLMTRFTKNFMASQQLLH
jgi:hypothetical protein